MAHTHDAHHAPGPNEPIVGHLVSYQVLFATGFALLVLTVITVAARYIDLGEANIYLAIGIAVVKATLVSLFFMHLRWDRPFNLMVLIGSMLFVVLMMCFCMMDVGQYQPTLDRGNAPDVIRVLEKDAPFAPIIKK